MALQDELHTGCGQIGNADVAIVRAKISSYAETVTGVVTCDGDLNTGN